MNEHEIPTSGQLATMCANCGVQPAMPRSHTYGRRPIYCETCRAEVSAESWRRGSRKTRADPDKREKAHALTRQWLAEHPGHRGRSHRRMRYGLKPEHIAMWFAFQNGLCALCGLPLDSRFSIDHDHDSGIVRGLLHTACNAHLDKHPDSARYKAGWLA